jgi:hypothetical protein
MNFSRNSTCYYKYSVANPLASRKNLVATPLATGNLVATTLETRKKPSCNLTCNWKVFCYNPITTGNSVGTLLATGKKNLVSS